MTEPLEPAAARWDDGMQLRVLVDASASDGHLALCKLTAPAGSATRVHVHEHEDEVVHVVRGALDVWTRSEHRIVGAGESFMLARGVPHRLAAAHANAPSETTEALVAFLPGGFEATLLAALPDDPAAEPLSADDLAALLAGAGVRVLPWERPPLLEA